MTKALSGQLVAARIEESFPGAVTRHGPEEVHVLKEKLPEVARFLCDDNNLAFNYLAFLTSVDYVDFFEVVYRLVSFRYNHLIVIKTQVFEREAPTVPSLIGVWRGAENQEREVYDLMGVRFEGHPNLKRIFLWEGFDGHPLRKDFLLQRP